MGLVCVCGSLPPSLPVVIPLGLSQFPTAGTVLDLDYARSLGDQMSGKWPEVGGGGRGGASSEADGQTLAGRLVVVQLQGAIFLANFEAVCPPVTQRPNTLLLKLAGLAAARTLSSNLLRDSKLAAYWHNAAVQNVLSPLLPPADMTKNPSSNFYASSSSMFANLDAAEVI